MLTIQVTNSTPYERTVYLNGKYFGLVWEDCWNNPMFTGQGESFQLESWTNEEVTTELEKLIVKLYAKSMR